MCIFFGVTAYGSTDGTFSSVGKIYQPRFQGWLFFPFYFIIFTVVDEFTIFFSFFLGDDQISGTGKKNEQEYQFKPLSILGQGMTGLVFYAFCESSENEEAHGKYFALKTNIVRCNIILQCS